MHTRHVASRCGSECVSSGEQVGNGVHDGALLRCCHGVGGDACAAQCRVEIGELLFVHADRVDVGEQRRRHLPQKRLITN
jgi:hypothetical protein